MLENSIYSAALLLEMIHISGSTPTELSVGVFMGFFSLFVVVSFGDPVATRATVHTLRKGNSLASHFKVQQ